MDELRKLVTRVQRRLELNRFLSIVGWTLSASLAVALLALLIPRLWIVEVDHVLWDRVWLIASFALGLVLAVVIMSIRSGGSIEAAIELDRRFALKERISSTLLLSAEERDSEFGKALTSDALGRAARLDVPEKFRVEPTWRLLLPLVPALAVFVVAMFVSPLERPADVEASQDKQAEAERIREASEGLKKKLEEQKKEAEAKGLTDAKDLFQKLEKAMDDLAKEKNVDQKEATVKLNDLAKDIKQKRDSLAKSDEVRQQLSQLGKLDPGPADKFSKAVKEGDFEKAAEQIKELKDKLEKNELDAEKKEQLEKQLDQLEKKLRDRIENQKQAAEDVKKQLDQAKAQGNEAAADKLQQQLDKLEAQQDQMQGLQDMADQIAQANQSLKQGDGKAASKQMQQLQDKLQGMQKEMQELKQMDNLLDQVADAKQSMKCEKCGGKGCKQCQGGGQPGEDGRPGYEPDDAAQDGSGDGAGKKEGRKSGNGGGEGQARGARPDGDKKDGKFYDSQVAGKVNPGPGVVVGKADGPNVAGNARIQVEHAVSDVKTSRSDPLSDQEVPKDRREHARQYFDKIRDGK